MPQYPSYPYFDIARAYNVDYGMVLHYVEFLERGSFLTMDGLRAYQLFGNPGPTGSAIRYAFEQEQERRKEQYGFADIDREMVKRL